MIDLKEHPHLLTSMSGQQAHDSSNSDINPCFPTSHFASQVCPSSTSLFSSIPVCSAVFCSWRTCKKPVCFNRDAAENYNNPQLKRCHTLKKKTTLFFFLCSFFDSIQALTEWVQHWWTPKHAWWRSSFAARPSLPLRLIYFIYFL